MNGHGIPELLGSLSHDLIMVYDEHYVIREANALALHFLGEQCVGQALPTLFADMAYDKGMAFLAQANTLQVGQTGEPWELLLNTVHIEPTLIKMRAGRWQPQSWLLVGMCDSPQLTALYHEVLEMNSELTNLIRQLSQEQSRLSGEVSRLLQTQE
jgi:hypothetical protein